MAGPCEKIAANELWTGRATSRGITLAYQGWSWLWSRGDHHEENLRRSRQFTTSEGSFGRPSPLKACEMSPPPTKEHNLHHWEKLPTEEPPPFPGAWHALRPAQVAVVPASVRGRRSRSSASQALKASCHSLAVSASDGQTHTTGRRGRHGKGTWGGLMVGRSI